MERDRQRDRQTDRDRERDRVCICVYIMHVGRVERAYMCVV